jgi:D-alanyl-D-alanine dipeptidase
MFKNRLQKYLFYSLTALGFFSCSWNSDISINRAQHKAKNASALIKLTLENEIEKPDTLEQRLVSLGLVDVQSVNATIRVSIKYSTIDNFMKTNVYGKLKKAFLQKEVAEKLSVAQNELTKIDSNLFLLVYDAARPLWVQWKMWHLLDSIPVHERVKFVSNPRRGSVHNYGAAVDLTICDFSGNPLDMGAGFDDSREIAYPAKEAHFLKQGQLTQRQIKNRQLLRKVMKSAGFKNIETEWWHFNAMTRNEAKRTYEIVP